jgi:hypothetical protein
MEASMANMGMDKKTVGDEYVITVKLKLSLWSIFKLKLLGTGNTRKKWTIQELIDKDMNKS